MCQGGGLDLWSGHVQEATYECTNKWNNKPMFLSLSLKPILKNRHHVRACARAHTHSQSGAPQPSHALQHKAAILVLPQPLHTLEISGRKTAVSQMKRVYKNEMASHRSLKHIYYQITLYQEWWIFFQNELPQ